MRTIMCMIVFLGIIFSSNARHKDGGGINHCSLPNPALESAFSHFRKHVVEYVETHPNINKQDAIELENAAHRHREVVINEFINMLRANTSPMSRDSHQPGTILNSYGEGPAPKGSESQGSHDKKIDQGEVKKSKYTSVLEYLKTVWRRFLTKFKGRRSNDGPDADKDYNNKVPNIEVHTQKPQKLKR
uniref:Uncharacterized protein n=1 Tax=Spongospora subterranea TaxID=70186 RepID=A0A0H5RU26_9EUKA|eukprot:CRZ12244.1 hypothetical protein [Spongospora subterranea]